MESARNEAEAVTTAVSDALRNTALSEAVFNFGGAQIILTKAQRLTGESIGSDEAPPEYPVIQTTLSDEADSWLN